MWISFILCTWILTCHLCKYLTSIYLLIYLCSKSERKHVICVFLCLVYFAQSNSLKFYLSKMTWFCSLGINKTPLHIYIISWSLSSSYEFLSFHNFIFLKQFLFHPLILFLVKVSHHSCHCKKQHSNERPRQVNQKFI